MLDKTKSVLRKLRKHPNELTKDDVAPALEYIERYWRKLERYHPKDDESLLGLPNRYLVPAFEEGHEFDFNEMYYWDSYFMAQGIMTPERKELAVGMLENLVNMFERFGIVPNASRTYLMGRSQPPFLTSYIFDVYEAYDMGEKWLHRMMKVAEAEYRTVWMGTAKPHARQVYRGLSRYYDINYLNDLAETESGWDMTPRFGRKCLDYLPADLNALLFKYEMDFARYNRIMDHAERAAEWELKAKQRKATMDDLMWSETRGLYYDYNYVKERRGTVSSLAGLYPLWAGMVTQSQAADMRLALKRFENKGGLSATDVQTLNALVPGKLPTQWAHPNGWAPLHFLIVKGLQNYGYHDDARRIALKWLKTNLDWFSREGVFLEKYNVVQPDKPPMKGVYPSQTGFGWTNAVFIYFCKQFIDGV